MSKQPMNNKSKQVALTKLFDDIHLNLGIKKTARRIALNIYVISRYCFEFVIAHLLFPHLTIKTGPFAGIRYPYFPKPFQVFSTMLPKLLGSYESELTPALKKLSGKKFATIINIGSDDGYYAVGLAKQHPKSKIIAIDICLTALQFSQEFAKCNHISQTHFKISTDSSVENLHTVIQLPSLVVSDCESAEKVLLDPQKVPSLKFADMLVEVHDAIDPTISKTLKRRFKQTHTLEIINQSDSSSLTQFCLLNRLLTNEMRPNAISWFHFTPKET